ncbi:hypothetical protein NDU88_003687 [Pleurodeles waltl]|uniref:Uncharacterized protein n=1 Tax=Pleurodeles waltl TaxID=8319 RepID=A0AAV7SGP2_PLEWA|nr:hypothetical protein NDU88_003687 [Pleurodeles waltl]
MNLDLIPVLGGAPLLGALQFAVVSLPAVIFLLWVLPWWSDAERAGPGASLRLEACLAEGTTARPGEAFTLRRSGVCGRCFLGGGVPRRSHRAADPREKSGRPLALGVRPGGGGRAAAGPGQASLPGLRRCGRLLCPAALEVAGGGNLGPRWDAASGEW